ncbi:Centrosomal spindle body, CEP44-domain-containing protein, partial [Haematococcus lacustris]
MNGDLAGKVARVQRELQQLKYPAVADETGLRLGDPVALLPLLHFVLLKFSRHVAQCIHKAGYELQGKTDAKFVEGAFRLMRDAFSIKTVLTAAHFLEQGFAERKLLLLCDVIQCCKKIHNDEIRKERLAALKTRPGGPTDSRLSEPSRKAPDVKIVKGGWEVRQVMQLQHMPNSSDGGHSVFQVKRQIVTASPAVTPPTSSQPAAGPSLRHATAMPPSRSPHSAAPSAPWEPAPAQPWSSPSVQAGQAAADSHDRHHGTAAGQGNGLAALSTPIHSWFVNPTFREPPEENGAWPSPGPQQPGGSHTAHLTAAYLAAPVAVSRGVAAGQGGAGLAGCSAPGSWWDPSESERSRALGQTSAGRAAAAGAGLVDSGLGGLGAEGGSRGVASGLHAGPAWFSGAPLSGPPGCQSMGTAAGGQGPHGPSQTGSASEANRHQELAQAPTPAVHSAAWSWAPAAEARQAGSQGAMPNGFNSHSSSGPGSSADGPVAELGHITHRPTGPSYFNPAQPRHASPAPSQQQQPGADHVPDQLTASQAEAQGPAAGASPAEVDAEVGAVRAELAAQVEAL